MQITQLFLHQQEYDHKLEGGDIATVEEFPYHGSLIACESDSGH